MLKLRDISLKKRILLTNFLMIALPVGFLLVLGGLLFAGLKTTGTIREAELALLWQDKREALSIQLAISSLKAKADRGKKVSEMEADCRALERWGIDSLIAKNGEIVYASPGADPQELLQDVQILAGGSRSFLRWDERGLALLYRAEKTRTVIIARGLIPFHARAPKEEDPLHDVWEILAYIFLAAMAIVITALGRYLARLLSEQILSPLEKLKTAAEEIRRGNLDASPAIDSADEIGAVGRSFDFMRQSLKEEKARREKYDENRKELIAGISHDLATPLTAIKGYASGILDGIAFSKDKLFDRIWGMDALGDTATVMVHINRIREKIEPNPATPIYIETVWGVGYRFRNDAGHKG
nr:winged helix-turn-helix domain-containing protein [uncultured Selenomonas sp.]